MFDAEAVLAHYQKPVPRYTSYPTAPQFKEGVGAELFKSALANLESTDPVSAYLHIPFCDRLCWFCGCHTKHTLKYTPIKRYIDFLVEEVNLFARKTTFKPLLGALHLGGGSPSLLKRDDLIRLRQALEGAFDFNIDTEISVEIDPSDVDQQTIDALTEFGLNRASVGVQDFHPDVQSAINRPQSFEITRDVIQQLRKAGVNSINIDALYGLPLQSKERLLRTIDQCVGLEPDRIALFGYAHVPWLKKHQNMINTDDLAGPFERYVHAESASSALVATGYRAIGIDHFAKPEDALAKAQNSGNLHRNFQGYTTDHHQTMIGFGASSIGRIADGYVQNTVPTLQYQAQISDGVMPKNKGLLLSVEDRLRGQIIERLMCDFKIDFASLNNYPAPMVDRCLKQAQLMVTQDEFDLCVMDGTSLIVAQNGRPFTRIIAAHFDAYYTPDQLQYSRAV